MRSVKRPTKKNIYLVVSSTDRGTLKTSFAYYNGSPNWYSPSKFRVLGFTMDEPNLIERLALEKILEMNIGFPFSSDGRLVSICFRYNPDSVELIACSKKERRGW